MTRQVLIVILLQQVYSYGYAQLPPDSIAAIKNRLNSARSDSSRFIACMDLSQGYRFSNIDSALYYTNEALALSRRMNSAANEATAVSQKGYILLETGNIPSSLQFQMEALRLSEKFSDPVIQGFTLNRIGNVYAEIGDYKKSLEYYRMAITLFTSAHQQGYVHNELSNIGNVYEMMNELDSAKIYQEKVYKYSLTNTDRYAITYGEMERRFGKVETRLGNYDAALMHFRSGIVESIKDVDFNNLALNYLELAKLFKHLKVNDSCFFYAKKALETANSISLKRAIYEASGLLAGLFKIRNQPDSALVYTELSSAIKDSLYGYTKTRELERILLDEQQRHEQFQREQEQLRQQYRLIALIAALVIFLIIGIILFRNNQRKQKANKILQATLADLKSTQAQLIQSEKMASLGELTAGIAHEIQNPLNFVNNFSDVNRELLTEMKDEMNKGNLEEVKSIANNIIDNEEKINQHGKRADAIVKSMLQHSRSSTGKKEPTDINALADEYLRLAYHGLRAKDKSFNATFKTNFDNSIEKINVIPQDIGRVILNLVTNAFYAVNEKKRSAGENYEPTVIVSTRKLNNTVEIRVRDNGNGIPQKVIDKIFQPFFTTKPTGQGTGLGLSMSYDIVTKGHGGTLKVETKEGEYTAFIIALSL